MRPTRTIVTFAVAAALVVTMTSDLSHSPRAVYQSAIEAAGIDTIEMVAQEHILPAPTTTVAPVLARTARIPALPPAETARDEAALTAHVETVSNELAAQQAAHDAAQQEVAESEERLEEATERLEEAAHDAAEVGAPVPAEPELPAVPAVTTPTGEVVQEAAALEGTIEDVVTSKEKPLETVTPETVPGTSVTQQVEAINDSREAQAELSRAQAELVAAVTVAEVTGAEVSEAATALAAGEQALATLPEPDPRWPDGCPTETAGGTMRNGADKIGIYQLCADSVAAAPTPEAAGAIKWALSHLGKPYSQPKRNEDGYADCSSFLTRAYTAGGLALTSPGTNAPTTAVIATAPWAKTIPYSEALPGDLVLPEQGHVVMVLAHGYIVHTSTTGDVSHVRNNYDTTPWLTKRIG